MTKLLPPPPRKFELTLVKSALFALGLTALPALSAPTGGEVVAGVANITTQPNITNINQSSQNAVINWQSFNVAPSETVNFHQPNREAVTLNRVIGNERSVIDGAMNANGKVFIQNANGTLIGKNAQINVGSLVATTANISDDDFMSGRHAFVGEGTGSIENLGQISVPKGGVVALVAPIVKNGGKITAPEGNVLLASAESFSITLPDNANFKYTLDKGTLQGLVDNGGAILADGGRVVLTAKGVDSVKKSLIKHSGSIEANTVQNKNGVIELLGDLDNSALNVSGSLKAEAKESGDGGFIETSASKVTIDKNATISTNAQDGKTGTWVLDPTDFVVAKTGGDLTGDEVGQRLSSTNIQLHTINSNDGKNTNGKGDIIINDEISWNKNTLTLKAHNDIHINATLNGTGTAKLALEYGQGVANPSNSNYYIETNTPVADRTAKINLPEGETFSTKQGRTGATNTFQVIHKMPDLIENTGTGTGTYSSELTHRNIAIGKDIDVSYTKNYKNFAGWEVKDKSFLNRIHGLGHTISGLTLDTNTGEVGLITHTYQSEIRNLGVSNVNIKSSYSHTGGLAGSLGDYTTITDSYANGDIEGSSNVGGLAGSANKGVQVINSHFLGNIKGNDSIGGLIGFNYGNIENSYAIAETLGTSSVGGLVGFQTGGYIKNSHASGQVGGGWSNAGGLVGYTYDGALITSSYANTQVNGRYSTGGLVGHLGSSTIKDSYATGNVRAESSVGGLVGTIGNGTIINTYAAGNVNATVGNVGGLVGEVSNGSKNTIKNSHAFGEVNQLVSGNQNAAGGLIGRYYNFSGSETLDIENSSFTNAQDDIIGEIYYSSSDNQPTIKNSQKKQMGDYYNKATYTGYDFDKVWYMNDGETPRLHAHKKGTVVITPTIPPTTPPTTPTPVTPVNKTDLTVNAHHLNKVYDGKAVATENDLRAIATQNGYGDIVTITGLKNGDTLDKLGKLSYNGTWQNAKNAGKYSILPTGLTGGQDYEIKYGEGSLTIDKKPISITVNSCYDGTNTAKIYDKNDKFFGKQIMGFNGIVKGDEVSLKLGTTGTLNNNQAGNTTLKDLGNLALEGSSANNYTINKDGSTWTINKRPVKVTGSREYNGSEWVNGADLNIDKSDIVAKDQLLLNVYTGDVKLDSKDAKNGRKIIDTSKISFGGKDGENYEIDKLRSSVDITPKNISVEVSKEYDGTNEFTKGFKIKGVIDGENPNIHISKATVAGKDNISDDVDYDKFTSISIAMPDKNYKFENGKGDVIVRILPKTITITPKDGQKIRFNQDDYKNLSYTHSQLVGNDKITGYLQPNNPNVGTRRFGLGTLSAGKNYKLVLSADKYVEITPIPLTIQAIDQSYNTAKNVFSGMGAKDSFNRKLFNIIKDKNLKYPDQILYTGSLEIKNERDLQFITAPTGKYDITQGDLNFSGNYDINFIPATYTVYTQYPNQIVETTLKVGDKIFGVPEKFVLETGYGVYDHTREVGKWVVRVAEDIEGLPLGQQVAIVIVGGAAAAGELAQAGLSAMVSTADAVLFATKEYGTYAIDAGRFIGMSDEQINQFKNGFQQAVDIGSFLYSLKDIASFEKMDTKQIEEQLKKELKEKGYTGKQATKAIKYWKKVGAITENGIRLDRENILSLAFDFYDNMQKN